MISELLIFLKSDMVVSQLFFSNVLIKLKYINSPKLKNKTPNESQNNGLLVMGFSISVSKTSYKEMQQRIIIHKLPNFKLYVASSFILD
jgi:hypothetical protein